MTSNWFGNAIVAMIAMIPLFFTVGLLERRFGLRSDITAVLWMVGTSIGILIWILSQGRGAEFVLRAPHIVLLGMGLVLGAITNVCLFRSFASAPNPGLTVAIVNANAVLAILIGGPLAMLLPRYFEHQTLSWGHWVGSVLVVSGVFLIGIKR